MKDNGSKHFLIIINLCCFLRAINSVYSYTSCSSTRIYPPSIHIKTVQRHSSLFYTSFQSRSIADRRQRHRTTRFSSDREDTPDNEVKLILGDDLSKNIASVGSEHGYLSAAKRRAEEYAKRRTEEAQQESSKTISAGVNNNNYGPSDLSSWRGFANDGFESSAGNDGKDGWEVKGGILMLDAKQKDQTSTTDTQSGDAGLFLFDEKNDGKLIL
jgi:hypothetical protein